MNSSKSPDENITFLVGLTGFVLSSIALYLGTLRPFLRKPRLSISLDKQWSEPTMEEDIGSWFYRFKVENYGLSKADKCVGRLLGVWSEEGEELSKFDPLPLYWSRQGVIKSDEGEISSFNPISIQGFGDFNYLDLAQIKEECFKFRIVIPTNMPLTVGEKDSISPGNAPNINIPSTFYIRVGIFAEQADIVPKYYKVSCDEASLPARRDTDPCECSEVKNIPNILRN